MTTEAEARLRKTLEVLERTGTFVAPEDHASGSLGPPRDAGDAAVGGCFVVFQNMLFGAPRHQQQQPMRVPTQEVSALATGAPKKADKLALANEAVQVRAAELRARMETLRAAAGAQARAGQKKQALTTLKRSKVVEQQMGQAEQAAMMLEAQTDMIESASVQHVVTQALSAAVKKSKRSTKGLLSRAEAAADGASDMAELNQDLAATLGEMSQNDHDDDELMAEIESMASDAQAPSAAAAAATAPSAAATAVAQMPHAPTARVAASGNGGSLVEF